MAAPLRYPLILLAWGAMAAIYLPLLPAAGELVGAARSPAHWRALFAPFLLHISRPPRRAPFSYSVFFFKKKKTLICAHRLLSLTLIAPLR
ncbi:hypothetical protein, partial [Klebsiella pneumoniae]|uniref:hypothetical protein n=1 Tax=Klebsiella pneumoniae TaxID=573 RepID=UPI001C5CC14D